MTQITLELWHAYQNSIFLLTQALSANTNFAIVTAANPLGVSHNVGQNRLFDRQMQHDIQQLQVPYRRIIGASPDGKHREPGWAVMQPLAEAIALAARWRQLAIYYVQSDRLGLVSCDARRPQVDLGLFSARATVVSELPRDLDDWFYL
ncbi:DUF3293 domain-containing protein [Shewanella sp. NIFS-20-20]|uniref:DUF3293 domain-containing protein n=1 Tax=Shewanella sp. NIFS-20-20 TaxID=2853806 RepID=UPI001C46DDC8|nr:DUF3293 domain-containing protein [Shewanella sp. NIFS-20-20]MBV7314151.1 DUF3293 domain-containing protein [Shewanella sp. NIFS-20-20]